MQEQLDEMRRERDELLLALKHAQVDLRVVHDMHTVSNTTGPDGEPHRNLEDRRVHRDMMFAAAAGFADSGFRAIDRLLERHAEMTTAAVNA